VQEKDTATSSAVYTRLHSENLQMLVSRLVCTASSSSSTFVHYISHGQLGLVAWMQLFPSDCSVLLQTQVFWLCPIWILLLVFPQCSSSIYITGAIY
jgi:hypothetical protein